MIDVFHLCEFIVCCFCIGDNFLKALFTATRNSTRKWENVWWVNEMESRSVENTGIATKNTHGEELGAIIGGDCPMLRRWCTATLVGNMELSLWSFDKYISGASFGVGLVALSSERPPTWGRNRDRNLNCFGCWCSLGRVRDGFYFLWLVFQTDRIGATWRDRGSFIESCRPPLWVGGLEVQACPVLPLCACGR